MRILLYYTYEYTRRSGCLAPLEKAAKAHGHEFYTYYIEQGPLSILPFKPDVVLTRTSVSGTEADYKSLEALSYCPIINTGSACKTASDKAIYYDMLRRSGVSVPSYLIKNADTKTGQIEEFISKHGLPMVGKLPISSQGRAVYLLQNRAEVDIFIANNPNCILQQYVQESAGRDIRSFVLGDRIFVTYERYAKQGDFRTNVACGGTPKLIECTEEIKNVSLQTAKSLGLEIAGIDLLYSKGGLTVCDVNAAPALDIEYFTFKNAADAVIAYLENKVMH